MSRKALYKSNPLPERDSLGSRANSNSPDVSSVAHSCSKFDRISFIKIKHSVYFYPFLFMVNSIQCSLWCKIVKKKKKLRKSCFLDLERIKMIYINYNGKNSFGFGTTHFSNSLLERIMFQNRGLTV